MGTNRSGYKVAGAACFMAIMAIWAYAALTPYRTLVREARAGNTQAVYRAMLAAWAGYASAQHNAGVLYDRGWGVLQNHIKAVAWYRKAAMQRNAAAEYNLGVNHDNGWGVPQSSTKARYWYTAAAVQGYARAENALGIDYRDSPGVPQNHAKAIYWFRKAAAQGYAKARSNLAAFQEQQSSPLKLFGAGLKEITRGQLEPVLVSAGLAPHKGQVGAQWWSDQYDVNGRVKGATRLMVGYTYNNRFAIARYTFPGLGDTGLVRRVIGTVKAQYGAPTRVTR